MKTISTLIVAAGLACAAPLALACGMKGCPQGGWMLEQMDQNKDGTVSKKEFDKFHSDRFKELDANKDGKVSQDEMGRPCAGMAGKGPMAGGAGIMFEQRFDEVDINHDGALSKDEAEIGMPMVFAHFDEHDTDKDGKLSKDEIVAGMKQMHQQMRDKCDPKTMKREQK